MSDTPKFEVIDRRKMKAEEEQEHAPKQPEPAAAPTEASSGPRLVVSESSADAAAEKSAGALSVEEPLPEMPDAPSVEESRQQTMPPRNGSRTWFGRRIPPWARSRP
jgi:hypothetical protein